MILYDAGEKIGASDAITAVIAEDSTEETAAPVAAMGVIAREKRTAQVLRFFGLAPLLILFDCSSSRIFSILSGIGNINFGIQDLKYAG